MANYLNVSGYLLLFLNHMLSSTAHGKLYIFQLDNENAICNFLGTGGFSRKAYHLRLSAPLKPELVLFHVESTHTH